MGGGGLVPKSYYGIHHKLYKKQHRLQIYGQPEVIISDNVKKLNNDMMKQHCDLLKIRHLNSTIYRPKLNGAVEAANKNLKTIIEKIVGNHRGWQDLLPLALLAYWTSIQTSTGATPYSLVYGMEAVLPIEVEIPSLKTLLEANMSEDDWIQARHDQLAMIEEKRTNVVYHGQLYQKKNSRAYNKKVWPRTFNENDLVLKKIFSIQDEAKGKFAPN